MSLSDDQLNHFFQRSDKDVIKYLLTVVDKQQQQIAELEKWMKKQYKKLDIIHWLNQQYPSQKTFQTWFKNITVERKQLEYIFTHGLIDGLHYILQENLPVEKEESFPIRCFNQKPRTFYIFQGTWKTMKEDDLDEMVSHIRHRIIQEFKKWQDENEAIINDSKRNEIFFDYVKKVMGGKLSKKKIYEKLRRKLFTYLKFNLRDIVHYSFSF